MSTSPSPDPLIQRAAHFIAKHKALITVTSLVSVSAISYYLYNNNANFSSNFKSSETAKADSTEASSKKKSKKKKKKSNASNSKESSSTNEISTDKSPKLYPVDSQGLPSITEEIVSGLSDSEKSKWSSQLKEDGNVEFKNKNFETAIKYYTAALQLKKDHVFYSNRSACYASLDDHENVIRDTTAALALKPDYSKCLVRRANSYEKLEKYNDAMFDLTALTVYGGFNNKPLETSLERVLKKHSIKIVQEKLKNRKIELPSASSISSFFGAFLTELTPEGISENSEVGSGDYYLYQGLHNLNINTPESYELADSFFNQAIEAYKYSEIKPDDENAAKCSIALEYTSGFKFLKNQVLEAYNDIEKAINLIPRSRTYIFLALLAADRSGFEEAIQYFNKAIELDANNADIYYQLGQMHYLTENLAKSEENFIKAKDLNPNNVYSYIQLACISYKRGNFPESENKFLEAKLKFPTSPEVPNYYGEILADKGEVAAAIKQFDTAIRLQEAVPEYSVGAIPLINKASIIVRDDFTKLKEAEQLLVKAVEIDNKSELAKITLAQFKLQQDEAEDAIVLFEESVDLARSFDEKIQATSFAEASKMQLRIKKDPLLSAKVKEVMAAASAGAEIPSF